MVGPAGDTKLIAFQNMCFSKPPHFGNRGATPVVLKFHTIGYFSCASHNPLTFSHIDITEIC